MNEVAAKSVAAPSAPFYRRKPSRRTVEISAVFLAALVILLLLFDWNWFKGPLERKVHAQTGREFHIGGNLDVNLGRITTVSADALSFGNASWSKKKEMAAAERAEVDIQLWPLLFKGEARIPEIRLTKPRLRLETGPQGTGNWIFGEPGGNKVRFRKIWIDDGRLQFFNAPQKTDIDISVNSANAPSTARGSPYRGRGQGALGRQPFHPFRSRRIPAGTEQHGSSVPDRPPCRRPDPREHMRAASWSTRSG